MTHNIGRTLFWFDNGPQKLLDLNNRYFAIGNLLNRLMNEVYTGKKIKFINLYFSSNATYALYPALVKNGTHYYNGHLLYYDVFDFDEFNSLTESQQDLLIWEKAASVIKIASNTKKNTELYNAVTHAYRRGIDIDLCPDYKLIQTDGLINNSLMNASVWVNFKKDGMYSKFSLEKDKVVVLEKDLDKTKNGVEFFLEMYKKIEIIDKKIIIRGDRDVEYLPMTITIPDNI